MPQSAIAAGCVDFVLPPDWIAEELARSCEHPYVTHSPSSKISALIPDSDPHLENILLFLWLANKIDFCDYKPATVKRRILRRMTLHRLEDVKSYVHFLQPNPTE